MTNKGKIKCSYQIKECKIEDEKTPVVGDKTVLQRRVESS